MSKKFKTINFYAKTSDNFGMTIKDGDNNSKNYDGYPPSFLGHDGIELEIDLATGQILNWDAKAAQEQLTQMEEDNEFDE